MHISIALDSVKESPRASEVPPPSHPARGASIRRSAYTVCRSPMAVKEPPIVLDAIGIDRYLPGAGLLITGEARIDNQTGHGKATGGVACRARQHGVPVIALAGAVPAQTLGADSPFDACFSICPP